MSAKYLPYACKSSETAKVWWNQIVDKYAPATTTTTSETFLCVLSRRAQDLRYFRTNLRETRGQGNGCLGYRTREREKERDIEPEGVRRHRVARRHPLPRVILHYPMRLVGGHVELVARAGDGRRLSSRRRKMTRWSGRVYRTSFLTFSTWKISSGPGHVWVARCPLVCGRR